MSLARQYAVVGQQATAAIEEEAATHLQSGNKFNAKIVPIEDTSLNDALGIDARATDIFYIRDKSAQRWINTMDIVSALGNNFMLIPSKAPNQPSTIHLVYHAIAGVKGKDDWA